MKPIIEVDKIGKRYMIARQGAQPERYVALRDVMARQMRALVPSRNGRRAQRAALEEFWALKSVSFEVAQGERVGIIGRNGAGKSTLLKVLSRITEPTTGRITMRGRVASLLEVGTGFHPELTGRENIFLNGAILGMSRAEIARKFDEIVAFAEVEQFLDVPVKRYSSGMYVRLAFAVAAHLEPEILIVDEVLAVGDAQFQKKCLGKMREVGSSGRTVLFVSHDMRAVLQLCDTGVVLTHGTASEKLPIADAVQQYSADITTADHLLPLDAGDVIVHNFQITQNGQFTSDCAGETAIDVDIDFELTRDLTLLRVGLEVRGMLGELIFRSLAADWDASAESLAAGLYRSSLSIPPNLISKGSYLARLHVTRFGLRNYLERTPVEMQFAVRHPQGYNEAHPGESDTGAAVILAQPWRLQTLARPTGSRVSPEPLLATVPR